MVEALPRAKVTVKPNKSVFTRETVTLKCEIEDQYSDWRYLWYTDTTGTSVFEGNILTIRSPSDQDEFWCRGEKDGRPSSSQDSDHVTLSVKGSKPKLTSDTEGSVLTGNTVTLKCHIDHWSTGWKFYWYKHTQNTEKTTTETNSSTIHSVKVSDGGQYWCRAGRGKPDYYTNYSDGLWIHVKENPKPVVSVYPDTQLFRGETVTLRCDIQDTGDTEWTYSWTVEKTNNRNIITQCNTQECKINNIQHTNSGKYTCRGKIREQNTEMSDAVTLTVSSDKQQTVLSVSPQQWLTEGDSVTLMCKVRSSSTGWTFSWFTVQMNKDVDYELVSDSIRGSKGIYTVSSVTVKHTGVYMCRAERGDPVYHTEYSNTQTLWITGVSRSVSLIIRPNRSQHFSSESLSLSCEDHSNSTGWTVRRYTDKLKSCSSSDTRSRGTKSTCTIRSLKSSDTGVYWCQSESGEKLHPVNISVHNVDVILDSPVHPVTEGDNLTLRCLYRDKKAFNLRAEFYKDGSVVQNQTTGDMMIIPTVSKSHEGLYYCKHTERGESPKSWISVRGCISAFPASGSSSHGLTVGLCLGLSVMFLVFFLGLLWCYKNKKLSQCPSAVSQQQNISQTSDQTQTEDTPLQTGINSERENTVYSKLKKRRDQVLISNIHSEQTEDVTPTLTVQPQTSVFIGDTVTLICEVHQSTGWEFIFINPSNTESTETTTKTIRSVQVSDGGEYKCRARRRGNPQVYTQYSEPITVTVQKSLKPVVSVDPDKQLFRGETVTMRCDIQDTGNTEWTYSWTVEKTNNSNIITQCNTQECKINNIQHTNSGKYTCRGKIREQNTEMSDAVTLTVSSDKPQTVLSVSPSVSLIIRPNRSQHFSSESLSLSCEDHSNSTGWTVRRYTENKLKPCSSSDWRSTGTTSTCTIRSLNTSDTGVYWCQSESGEKLHPINISVHNVDVILDSPVHPVTEGDPLTLHCLYRDKNPSNLRAEFYKDGSVVQNQTTGDMMIISTVSKSHEGFYYCKHPERGESPKSWISVIENTSDGDDIMYSKLKKGEDQDVASGSADVTNAQKK
ncbi:uncharacterized protein [Misgurnus anguillicaudatus]|uniref:uncharacterized protein n=1 Tax=Misgurnus anguillicaudatus TaxID=75329 RepID=UPI003CCFDC02